MITAVVLTKNEEKHIIDCLDSLFWCDEIIVIDDFSDDRTIDVVSQQKNNKIKVFKHALEGNFGAQRNFALGKAKGEWVLYVDVDERIGPDLADEIKQALKNTINIYDGFAIKRIDTMWGKKLLHGETGNIKLLRLAKKEKGRWENKVHEVWKIRGKIGELETPLMHFPHPTVAQFLHEINYYTDIRANELFEKKVKVSWWSIIFYPKAKFFVNFILKRGFLDGIPGFLVAMIMSMHSFLVRGKLWWLWQAKD